MIVKMAVVKDALIRSGIRNGHFRIDDEVAAPQRKTKRSSKTLRSRKPYDSVT